uniref:Uncharacterized protein n=1 Tax=Tetraselmis sp. GSL018 TaxID=582737 RepID=A0A061S7K3_9CHLO|mmetsp:Transcript_8960/g.21576  ORF Transcript_8960/g.21576 Transcript_8960/m.21576 type:complete len:113 (+) Transcript_8960:90-428(+)|eukprot:CAMPEP_0177596066 /NCGR_PEP_ID=MMETSP0419_2-20121207/10781_1 /TAXON_ID=582737 /ORGANISM="Tetraselmis sp., Strain GSL018" /LENGTH=112 /DNA_ID=CAMNT_0019087747 /DNA_START=71 /DNA_END=409 /DNA_ORIENTATION=-
MFSIAAPSTAGKAVSGNSLQRLTAKSSTVTLQRTAVPVIECKCRRNLKKEKSIRNRRRAQELKRMSNFKKTAQGPQRFQQESSSDKGDSKHYFHYDARGEPIPGAQDEGSLI